MKKILIAGNWKMNLTLQSAKALSQDLASSSSQNHNYEIVVFPPAVYAHAASNILKNSNVNWGLQNICPEEKGAFTGEVSTNMAKDLLCRYTLVGHSERRSLYGETDDIVAKKAKVIITKGIVPVICVGETLEQRDAMQTFNVLEKQLTTVLKNIIDTGKENIVVAYEPIWAIGTGLTATSEQAQLVHSFIRKHLNKYSDDLSYNTRIIYGGSVNSKNSTMLINQQDIDGVLVGGASLQADEFLKICKQES